MTAPAVALLSPRELDELWGRNDPDLELDQDGRLRPIVTQEPRSSRRSAIASAAPAVLGTIVSSVERWD